MSEDESFKKDGSYKKFLARVRAILWVWFCGGHFVGYSLDGKEAQDLEHQPL